MPNNPVDLEKMRKDNRWFKNAGLIGWIFGIITAAGFIWLMYQMYYGAYAFHLCCHA